MDCSDLEDYLRGLGVTVGLLEGNDGQPYIVVSQWEIPGGGLQGKKCDVALQRVETVPYSVPAAIHTRPHLVQMSPGEPVGTQPSPIGPEWQYWSRRFDRAPTPQAIWTHIVTILTDQRWSPI